MKARGDLGDRDFASNISLKNHIGLRIARDAVDPVFCIGQRDLRFGICARRTLGGINGQGNLDSKQMFRQ